MIEIQGMVAQLERHGVPVSVGCDQHSWRVVLEGEELHFHSFRDVGLFLNGLVYFTSRH